MQRVNVKLSSAKQRMQESHTCMTCLRQHLKSSQLLHVVLSSPIIQHLSGAFNPVASTLMVTEWPPANVVGTANLLQGSHTQTQQC